MGKLFVCVLAVLVVGCGTVTPDAGFEAVLVRKPWIFGSGGVSNDPVKAGRRYIAQSTDAVLVDMRPFQKIEEFNDLMSLDGVPLDFHAVARMQVTSSVSLIRDFGTNWYRDNVSQEFMRLVRDEVKKHGMNEVAINTQAADEIDAAVTKNLAAYLVAVKLPVMLHGVTLGRANPPDAIRDQRVETAAQEQRVNTEKQRAQAENARKEAEASRAIADNAYREAMKMSPEQFLQLEQIKMWAATCGEGKCTFLIGGGAVPTISVR